MVPLPLFNSFTLSGGTSVPSNIEWFLYLMCINQDAQKKARAEVDALGKDPTDNDDLDKLRYVEACVLETLRVGTASCLMYIGIREG